MEKLLAALGPLANAKKNARRAQQVVCMHHIQQDSGQVQTVVSAPASDSPTASYRRWSEADAPETPARASSESQRLSPVDDQSSSPEGGGDGAAAKSQQAAAAPAEPHTSDTPPTQEEPLLHAAETPAVEPPDGTTERELEPKLRGQRSPEQAGGRQLPLESQPEQELVAAGRQAKQRASSAFGPGPEPPAELDIRQWDRGFNIPKSSQREKRKPKSPLRPGTAPEAPSGSFGDAGSAVQRQPSAEQKQQRRRQRRPGPPGRQQQLPPVPTKGVSVSQHGKCLGIPKYVCEDCQRSRPVMGDRGTTEWNHSRWCESCAKGSAKGGQGLGHPKAVPTHPFADGWSYTINGPVSAMGAPVHWKWPFEVKGQPIEAASFTYFRTVDETQNLVKKVQELEWPGNGWTANNSAHREPPERAMGVASDDRDRAYVGEWTSRERERQYVQAKLCTPPRGLPHAADCKVYLCRGECLTVTDYHKPLPGGTGGPRSLQSQLDWGLSGAPVYIPGVLGGKGGKTSHSSSLSSIQDPVSGQGSASGGAEAVEVSSGGGERPVKRVTWEEAKKQRALKEKQKAQAARLRALQASSNSGGADRFVEPDVRSTRASSPQS